MLVCLTELFIKNDVLAKEYEGNDFYISKYSNDSFSGLMHSFNLIATSEIADSKKYKIAEQSQSVFNDTRIKLSSMIYEFNSNHLLDLNAQVALITQKLSNDGIPYKTNATGEGDWQPDSSIYVGGALHVQQDPTYRLDGFDCQTFVQVVMSLLHIKTLNDFDQRFVKIAYGAAGNSPNNEVVHFYNRNNFPSGDFNPVNEKNGMLSDATTIGDLKKLVKSTSANITRQNWFAIKQQKIAENVRVISDQNGPEMVERFETFYSALTFPHFDSEQVILSYIPKEQLANKQADGSYQPNQIVLDKIAVPSVVEIVRDVKQWNIAGKNIKDLIGSELNVSHMGLLYRQQFNRGDVIFQKTSCYYNEAQQKACDVTPVLCEKDQCQELMFAQATNAYPDGYSWYQEGNGFMCSSNKPAANVKYLSCNRVERLPFADYVTRQQYTSHPFMDTASIVGIHIEKIQ